MMEIQMRTKLLVLSIALAFCATLASATNSCVTCYIDYVNGSDLNDGQAKVTGGGHGPWQHLPGMVGTGPTGGGTDGCASLCAAQIPVAGDKYILKGGVVWPSTVFPINWQWSGTSSTTTFGCAGAGCIYVGNDPTWNLGIVNSVISDLDFGGCPSSVSVSISGVGG